VAQRGVQGSGFIDHRGSSGCIALREADGFGGSNHSNHEAVIRLMRRLFVVGWADQERARTHDDCEDECASEEQHDGAVHGAGR
jgi:hypothetical protein